MQERLERQAEERMSERVRDRYPGEWGVSAEILTLPTSADVEVVQGHRAKVINCKRADPFDQLHRAGGLSDHQHQAARRLFRDWCQRVGIQTDDPRPELLQKIDQSGAAELVTQGMIDAGKRVEAALKGVGRADAKLLRALMSPIIDHGLIIVWRGTVQRETGETERHAQGAAVRRACENLRLHYGIGELAAGPAANDVAA